MQDRSRILLFLLLSLGIHGAAYQAWVSRESPADLPMQAREPLRIALGSPDAAREAVSGPAVPAGPPPEKVAMRDPGPLPAAKPVPPPLSRRPEPRPERFPEPPEAKPEPLPEPRPESTQAIAPSPVMQMAGTGPVGHAKAQASTVVDRETLEEAYKTALREAIARHRRYPRLAKRLGQEGRVEIAFEVLADGRLEGVRVVHGSGHRRLDDAAVETVERLGRFEPIPSELQRQRWSLVVPLDFQLL